MSFPRYMRWWVDSSKPEGNLSIQHLYVDSWLRFWIIPFFIKASLPDRILFPFLLNCIFVLVLLDTLEFLGMLISPWGGSICPDSDASWIMEVKPLSGELWSECWKEILVFHERSEILNNIIILISIAFFIMTMQM